MESYGMGRKVTSGGNTGESHSEEMILSQALKDEKTLTECVLNSKNSMCKGPGVRLHLSMGLNVRPLCH